MKEKKISIIIPIYNVKLYLERCLNTIVNQTYSNLEIILVDDGSNDGSEKICDEWKQKDKRIKVIHKTNGGLSSARNEGIKISTGDYIQFVDSDDFIDLSCVEILYNNLLKYKADISMCGIIMTNDIYKKKMKWFENDQCLEKDKAFRLLIENNILTSHAWNKLFKREIFKEIIFPEGKLYEDIRIMHIIFSNINKVAITNQYLYYYFQRENSITTKVNINNKFEYIEAFYERLLFIKENNQDLYDYSVYRLVKVITLILITQQYPLEQIKQNKKNIKDMLEYIKQKDVKKAYKKYANSKDKIYYYLAVVFSTHISWLYLAIRNKEEII